MYVQRSLLMLYGFEPSYNAGEEIKEKLMLREMWRHWVKGGAKNFYDLAMLGKPKIIDSEAALQAEITNPVGLIRW